MSQRTKDCLQCFMASPSLLLVFSFIYIFFSFPPPPSLSPSPPPFRPRSPHLRSSLSSPGAACRKSGLWQRSRALRRQRSDSGWRAKERQGGVEMHLRPHSPTISPARGLPVGTMEKRGSSSHSIHFLFIFILLLLIFFVYFFILLLLIFFLYISLFCYF